MQQIDCGTCVGLWSSCVCTHMFVFTAVLCNRPWLTQGLTMTESLLLDSPGHRHTQCSPQPEMVVRNSGNVLCDTSALEEARVFFCLQGTHQFGLSSPTLSRCASFLFSRCSSVYPLALSVGSIKPQWTVLVGHTHRTDRPALCTYQL